jgi:tetratricopeptide (TPR) repeat protein
MALNQLKEASPGSPETFIKMGRNRLELGRLKEAQQFFMRATVKVREKDILRKAYIFHKIAETYKDNGKLMEAEKNYRQSLDYIKESELWRKTRIVMKYKKIKGETRAVLEEAPLAFEQRQRIVEIYKGYMSVLLKQVKQEREWDKIHREVIKAGEEALKFNPVEEKIWVYLSKAYERLGNREEAEKCIYNYRFFLQL